MAAVGTIIATLPAAASVNTSLLSAVLHEKPVIKDQ
jgi:hypothetical protein